MTRTLALIGLIAACNSDYELKGDIENPEGLPEEALDTADPIEPEPEPEPDPDAPVAVCSVSPDVVRPITDSASFLGSESYDPAGLELEYDWKLVDRPVGSTANMPTGSGADRHGFAADLAGEYVAELTVTNSGGVASTPCEAVLTAEPVEALWVEMFWEHAGDDMDLHLLAPGGALETSTDCYFANCKTTWGGGLDWGVPGDSSDDPILDLDDIPNTGPENINIDVPEDATYTVIVHDYPGSVFTAGNPVTVNIYLDGSLQWTDTRVISGEDTYTTFATIDVATSTVTSM